jgi:PPM family protein phosphatase
VSYQWASATHRGRLRSNNQDAVYPEGAGRGEGPVVLMVADGMGGAVGGEIASRVAVERAATVEGKPVQRVAEGNLAVMEEASRRPHLAGMGTTLTLVELGPDQVAHVAHVGDSRAYLHRGDDLQRLTADHTIVAEYVAEGKITPEEVATHPQRNILTRVLGLTQYLEIDEFDVPLEPNDRLLICSDGLPNMVEDSVIAKALAQGSPEEAVWKLVELANLAGGQDNITALVVDVES